MATQLISTIFSYAFVFLLGLILGAVGELAWSGRFAKTHPPIEPVSPQRIDIPQITVDLPGNPRPNEAQVENIPNPPVQVNAPVPTAPPITPVIVKEDPKKPAKALTIVEQVDEILQELQKFQDARKPNISLADDGKQGVIVKVGVQTFPGIDAVTDVEAQGMIRQAVTEWERRSTRK